MGFMNNAKIVEKKKKQLEVFCLQITCLKRV